VLLLMFALALLSLSWAQTAAKSGQQSSWATQAWSHWHWRTATGLPTAACFQNKVLVEPHTCRQEGGELGIWTLIFFGLVVAEDDDDDDNDDEEDGRSWPNLQVTLKSKQQSPF